MEEKNQYVRQVAEQKYEFGFTERGYRSAHLC